MFFGKASGLGSFTIAKVDRRRVPLDFFWKSGLGNPTRLKLTVGGVAAAASVRKLLKIMWRWHLS